MPRNGSGIASKPAGSTASPNTTIASTPYNATIDDLYLLQNEARPITAGGTGATSASAARINLGVEIGTNVLGLTYAPPGLLQGLTLSNNGADATNDIDIAAGSAASDDSTPILMALASGITKRLDAAWAVGTNAGGLDTGSVANGTYHVWFIRRSDTGVEDVLFSTSATSPTMPTSYDQKRRIGSIIRESAAIVGFKQFGKRFLRNTAKLEDNNTSAFTSALATLAVPTGIQVRPILNNQILSGNDANIAYLVGDASQGAAALAVQSIVSNGSTNSGDRALIDFVVTNTSGQIYQALTIASGSINQRQLQNYGWYDDAL